jgi:hypothetical protein
MEKSPRQGLNGTVVAVLHRVAMHDDIVRDAHERSPASAMKRA